MFATLICTTYAGPFEDYKTWKGLIQLPADFKTITSFLKKHGNWPRRTILEMKAENALVDDQIESEDVYQWFVTNKPKTVRGTLFYVRMLLKRGKKDEARELLRACILEKEIDAPKLKHILSEFGDFFDTDLLFERAQKMLSEEKISQATDLLPHLNAQQKDIIYACIALQQRAKNTLQKAKDCLVFQPNNAGLILDIIRYHRQNQENEQAIAYLKKDIPGEEKTPEAFWRERNLMARRLFDDKKFTKAYQIVKHHKLKSGEDFANASFLCGWLALTYKNTPSKAQEVFENLYNNVKSPITRSRAAFWMAESMKASGKLEKAQEWYQCAAKFSATYYGQLAQSRLNVYLEKTALKHNELKPFNPSREAKKKFDDHELVQVIKILPKDEPAEFIDPFFLKLAEELTDPDDLRQVVLLANKRSGVSGAVKACRDLGKYHQVLIREAYPIISEKLIQTILKASDKTPYLIYLVHAIICRESTFNPKATSPAGALGMMQLMPATAAREMNVVQKTIGVKPASKESLYNARKNILLGASHIKNLLDRYDGNFVLAICAYNAGESAVNEWLTTFGDPRKPGINMVQWVELIPYAETRNYVQRVLEKFMVYLSRFEHASAKSYDLDQFLHVRLDSATH